MLYKIIYVVASVISTIFLLIMAENFSDAASICSGKKRVLYAIIALIFLVSAFAIVMFCFNYFINNGYR